MEMPIRVYNGMIEELDEVGSRVSLLRAKTDRAFSEWYTLRRDAQKYFDNVKGTEEEVQKFRSGC